jgi:GxxExxY protein
MENDELSRKIIKAAYNVHNALGSGFLEKVYQNAMIVELRIMGLEVTAEYPINVIYKSVIVGEYFADLFVEESMVVELKAVENLQPIHEVQLVNYLHGTGMDSGLLINFGRSVTLKKKFRVYKKEILE